MRSEIKTFGTMADKDVRAAERIAAECDITRCNLCRNVVEVALLHVRAKSRGHMLRAAP